MSKICSACRRPGQKFGVNRSSKDGLDYACKECLSIRNIKQRKEHPERYRLHDRKDNARKKYGLSLEEYDHLAARENCDICGLKLLIGGPKRTLPSIDHNHKTGKIRGVLCSNCNVALGLLKDSAEIVEKAARYLRT